MGVMKIVQPDRRFGRIEWSPQMPALRPFAVIFPLLATLGCAHGQFTDPGRAWVTARSEHFLVHTDTGSRSYRSILERLEEARAALETVFFRGTDIPVVEAIVLTAFDYESAFGSGSAGLFVPNLGRHGSVLVVKDSADPRFVDEVVAHELAHRFVARRYPKAPGWLHEGLATFLGTVEVRDDALLFGATPGNASAHFKIGGTVPFAQLLAATPADLYGPGGETYYSTAWALMHYLVTGHRGAQFTRFLPLLDRLDQAAGDPRLSLDAFRELYPEQTLVELEEGFAANASRLSTLGLNTILTVEVPRRPAPHISVGPADREALGGLSMAVKVRHEVQQYAVDRAQEPALPKGTIYGRADLSIPVVRSYVGLAAGKALSEHTAVELALGLGQYFGYQVGLLARYHLPIASETFLTFGIGPMFALKSQALGNRVEHLKTVAVARSDLFYYLAANPELAFDIHAAQNILMHLALGSTIRLAENASRLCAGAQFTGPDGCLRDEGISGSALAGKSYDLYLRLGAGFHF
jgi:hypothetical protein